MEDILKAFNLVLLGGDNKQAVQITLLALFLMLYCRGQIQQNASAVLWSGVPDDRSGGLYPERGSVLPAGLGPATGRGLQCITRHVGDPDLSSGDV